MASFPILECMTTGDGNCVLLFKSPCPKSGSVGGRVCENSSIWWLGLHRMIDDLKNACEKAGIPHHFHKFCMPEKATEKFFADYLDQEVKNCIEATLQTDDLESEGSDSFAGVSGIENISISVSFLDCEVEWW